MKACSYCGRDNDDEVVRCRECGTEFPAPASAEPAAEPQAPLPAPKFIDLNRVEGAFDFRDGFSRPDWKRIGKLIQAIEGEEDRREAWREAALQWLEKLRAELGGEYQWSASRTCALLSPLDRLTSERLLAFSEHAVSAIRTTLREIAWESFEGLHVILVFSDGDDYYQYISDYYPDGDNPASIGIELSQGYPHVALHYETELESSQVIIHELTHHCLTHLPIPLWLNEGVAQRFQKTIGEAYVPSSTTLASDAYWTMMTGWKPPLVWDELVDAHIGFWNPERIQRFWAGSSFHEPGDSAQLSYSLAEILVHLLAEKDGDFLAFLRAAQADDAGQTAAWDCLGCCLGETVGTFLGPGDWRPQRKAIKTYWEAVCSEDETSGAPGV